MAGKSKRKKFGEFRVFVEYMRRGKYRIRPEFVPSLAAYLLMIGGVYERTIRGMEQRLALDTVPGLPESIATLRICQNHLQRMLDNLSQNFDAGDWQPAVASICQLMNIQPDSAPPEEILDGTFTHAISEEPTDGSEPRPG